MANNKTLRDFQRSCNGKLRYETWREARQAAKLMQSRDNTLTPSTTKVYPYECRYCRYIHIGHRD